MGSLPKNLSASRGASVLGISKYQTPVHTWLEIMEGQEPGFASKNGYAMPVDEDEASIRWGLAFEDSVIGLAEQTVGIKIVDQEKFFQKDYITCHIDGEYQRSKPHILHEGKTTAIFTFSQEWGEPGSDKIPTEYQVQCQHQMYCTGADKVIVSVLVFPKRVEEFEADGWVINFAGNTPFLSSDNHKDDSNGYDRPFIWASNLSQMGYFHQYEIPRNQELIDLMLEKYADFWDNHILKGVPPGPVNLKDIKALCPEPKGTLVIPDSIERKFTEVKQIRDEIGKSGTLSKRMEALKTEIMDWVRKQNPEIDEESETKHLFLSETGNKLGQYSSRSFIVSK